MGKNRSGDKKKVGVVHTTIGLKDGDDLLREEVTKAVQIELELLKKQVAREPIHGHLEKQVRMVISVLRMNISALRGTIIHDTEPEASARNAAVDRLLDIANAFDKKKHTPETFDGDARLALNELSETFKAFGPPWISIREAIVALALGHIEDLKGKKEKDPLEKEKAELEKLEKKAKDRLEKELTEKREREKAEKKQKKQEKKNRKAISNCNEDHEHDFGEERVPPQLLPCGHACNHNHEHHHDQDTEYEEVDVVGSTATYPSHLASDSSRSRSSSTSTSTNILPAISRIMTNDQWAQFCGIYDRRK